MNKYAMQHSIGYTSRYTICAISYYNIRTRVSDYHIEQRRHIVYDIIYDILCERDEMNKEIKRKIKKYKIGLDFNPSHNNNITIIIFLRVVQHLADDKTHLAGCFMCFFVSFFWHRSSWTASGKEAPMAEKQKVTASQPCMICGKPDWCYRLKFESGDTMHCCARVSDSPLIHNSYGEFVHIKSKETDIGEYHYYEESEEYERSRKAFKDQRLKGVIPKKVNIAPKEAPLLKGECSIADRKRLNEVYREFAKILKLTNEDALLLRKEWEKPTSKGLADKILSEYPLISLPEETREGALKRLQAASTLAKRVGDLRGIPGFYQNSSDNWTVAGKCGVGFPIFDTEGNLIRFRIREKYPDLKGAYQGKEGVFRHSFDKQGKHSWLFYAPGESPVSVDREPKGKPAGKYKNLSSVYEKEGVNFYRNGTKSGSRASLYAKESDIFSTVYVTEGEKKALVANTLLGFPVVSLPGTGTFMKLFESQDGCKPIMDYLITKGCKLIIIAYDADKGVNANVLKAEKKAIEEFKKRNLNIAVGEWNEAFGKGLDEILVQGVRPSIYICN